MNTKNDWVLREGLDVFASDGEKVGEVKDAMGESFSVKEGWFFPKEHIVPSSVITSVDDNGVYLGVTKDQALAEDWGSAATGSTWGNTPAADQTATGGIYDDKVATDRTTDTLGAAYDKTGVDDRTGNAAAGAYNKTLGNRGDTTTGAYNDTATSTDATTDTDSIRVPLSEEELVATRKEVDRGKVRVERDVVSEEQSIDVPVTEEEVHVSRRAVNRDVAPGEDAFQEGTIEIPVRGEEVDVEKRSRVTGELDIEKRAATRTERVSDTVRREEAHVVDENGVVVDDRSIVDSNVDTKRPARKKK